MGVDYKFYYGLGYFIPEEHAKEFYNMLLKDEYEEEYKKFLVDGFNPKKNPIALFVKIHFDAELTGVQEAKSQFVKKRKWVEPHHLPKEIVAFMKNHAKYGLIEFHHWY